SFPTCSPNFAFASSVTSPGSRRMVFFVCSSDTAAICTQAFGTSVPTGFPRSQSFSRTGASISDKPRQAPRGSLPWPLRRCSTPSRYKNRPLPSMAYHHSRNRACSSVNRHGSSRWNCSHRPHQARTPQPSVCSGSTQYFPSVCQVGPIRTGSHSKSGSTAGWASSARYQASISSRSSASSSLAAARLRAISALPIRSDGRLKQGADELHRLLGSEPGLDVRGEDVVEAGGSLAVHSRRLSERHPRGEVEQVHPVLLLHRAIAAFLAAFDTFSAWRPSSSGSFNCARRRATTWRCWRSSCSTGFATICPIEPFTIVGASRNSSSRRSTRSISRHASSRTRSSSDRSSYLPVTSVHSRRAFGPSLDGVEGLLIPDPFTLRYWSRSKTRAQAARMPRC